MKIQPKNWRDFQHYKDRNPPWIRLHKSLLDNFEFQCLPDASRALAPMLWLVASDATDGVIDAELEKLAFRLRRSKEWLADALKPLIDNGFFVSEQDASSLLAECKRLAVPETEALQRQKYPPTPRKRGGVSDGFARFWSAYPATTRKAAKEQCWRKWQKKGLESQANAICRHVEAMKQSEDWTKDKGAFIPAPLVYLNQDRFEAPTCEEASWHESRSGIEAKGAELGLGKWDQYAFDHGQGEPFKAYQARVFRAAGIEPRRAA